MRHVISKMIRWAGAFAPFAFPFILILTAGCGGGGISQATSGAPAAIPTNGLTHYWTADSVYRDSSGIANATPVGSVSFAPGIYGQAFQFDGVDQHVDITDILAMSPHTDTDRMTVGGWFFIDPNAVGNKSDLSELVSKSNGNTVGGGWGLAFDDRGIPVGYPPGYGPPFVKSIWFAGNNTNGVYGGTSVVARLDNAIQTAGWYHIMATFDPSATPQAVLYINGVAAANSGQDQIPFISTNGLSGRIGGAFTNEYGGMDNDRFNGLADEIRVYNRALTPSEMRTIFNAGAAAAGLPAI